MSRVHRQTQEPDRRANLVGWRDLCTRALLAAERVDQPAPELAVLACRARDCFVRPASVFEGGAWCGVLVELAHAYGRQRGAKDRETYADMLRTAARQVSALILQLDPPAYAEGDELLAQRTRAPLGSTPAWTQRADINGD